MLCSPTPEFPPSLHGLLEAEAYPHPVEELRLIQTHVSWILLTGPYAYKIKRRVFYPFLDLRSPRIRELYCREEVRLNRRFSDGLYDGVVSIAHAAEGLRVGGEGQIVEYAVRMAQFDPDQVLDRLLPARVSLEELHDFGRSMADFQSTLPAVDTRHVWGSPVDVSGQIRRNVAELLALVTNAEHKSRVALLQSELSSRLQARAAALQLRRDTGAVRECHGDLHARNVVRWRARLTAFDGLEFDPALRWIDVARDIALLDVDLRARGWGRWAHAMLQGWFDAGGDHGACAVLDLYRAHGALVRAKVSLLNRADEALLPDYLDAAEAALAPREGTLVLIGGLSGSGKTQLARELAPLIDAVHLSSDLERRRMSGRSGHESTGSELASGMYSQQNTEALYAELRTRAALVIEGHQSAIVDATFLLSAQRDGFEELARSLGCRVLVIWCEAPVELLRTRIVLRRESGPDASEADLRVLGWQEGRVQRPVVDGSTYIEVSTLESSATLARRIAAQLGS